MRPLGGFRRFRKPKCMIMIGGLFFVAMGTFYWSLWEIPSWLPTYSDNNGDDNNMEGTTVGDSNQNSPGSFLPEEPKCIRDTVLARPNSRSCVWTSTNTTSCKNAMTPGLASKASYIFLGDAHMAKLAQYTSMNWPFESLNVTTRRHHCQNLAYYGLPPPSQGWTPPDASRGEGPMAYGKENPYCSDCKKCWNLLMDTPATKERYLEYLVVEYARDVTIPTLVTNTTQETAAYYISRKSPSICVTSAGLNDAAIVPPISMDVYIQNFDKYLALLQRTCQHVVWIGIHAVVENESIPQSNCKLHNWNNAVLGQISMRDYDNVFYVDVWDTSLKTNHEGFLGLDKGFYSDLSHLFVDLMQTEI